MSIETTTELICMQKKPDLCPASERMLQVALRRGWVMPIQEQNGLFGVIKFVGHLALLPIESGESKFTVGRWYVPVNAGEISSDEIAQMAHNYLNQRENGLNPVALPSQYLWARNRFLENAELAGLPTDRKGYLDMIAEGEKRFTEFDLDEYDKHWLRHSELGYALASRKKYRATV